VEELHLPDLFRSQVDNTLIAIAGTIPILVHIKDLPARAIGPVIRPAFFFATTEQAPTWNVGRQMQQAFQRETVLVHQLLDGPNLLDVKIREQAVIGTRRAGHFEQPGALTFNYPALGKVQLA